MAHMTTYWLPCLAKACIKLCNLFRGGLACSGMQAASCNRNHDAVWISKAVYDLN